MIFSFYDFYFRLFFILDVFIFRCIFVAPFLLFSESQNKLSQLKQVSHPRLETAFVKEDDAEDRTWYLELGNSNVNAVYTVKIEFEKDRVRTNASYLNVPVYAAWSGNSSDTSRLIQAGSHDRVFLYAVHATSPGFFDYEFQCVQDSARKIGELVMGSWARSSEPKGEPETFKIKILISSEPKLADGNRVIEVECKGHVFRVISGNVAKPAT